MAMWALGGEEAGVAEAEGKGQFPLGRELTRDALLGKKPFAELPASYNVASSFDCKLSLANGNTIALVSRDNDLTITGEKGEICCRGYAVCSKRTTRVDGPMNTDSDLRLPAGWSRLCDCGCGAMPGCCCPNGGSGFRRMTSRWRSGRRRWC